LRDLFADRAAPRPIRITPRQPVLLAQRADDALGVPVHAGIAAFLERVCALRCHVLAAAFDRAQLVSADSAAERFLSLRRRVIRPLAALPSDRFESRPALPRSEAGLICR